jgi:hypothetical protein
MYSRGLETREPQAGTLKTQNFEERISEVKEKEEEEEKKARVPRIGKASREEMRRSAMIAPYSLV